MKTFFIKVFTSSKCGCTILLVHSRMAATLQIFTHLHAVYCYSNTIGLEILLPNINHILVACDHHSYASLSSDKRTGCSSKLYHTPIKYSYIFSILHFPAEALPTEKEHINIIGYMHHNVWLTTILGFTVSERRITWNKHSFQSTLAWLDH